MMQEAPPAGAGFVQAIYWRAADPPWRYLVINLVALASVPGWAFVFWVGAATAAGLSGAELVEFWTTLLAAQDMGVLGTLLVVFVVHVVAHEATHGLVMRLCGNHPTFGVKWYGVAYATAPGQLFTRDQFLAVALAPLIVLSLLGLIAIEVAPAAAAPWLLLALTANAIGAVGDLWMSAIVLRYPREAKIMDERDGIRIYVRREAA